MMASCRAVGFIGGPWEKSEPKVSRKFGENLGLERNARPRLMYDRVGDFKRVGRLSVPFAGRNAVKASLLLVRGRVTMSSLLSRFLCQQRFGFGFVGRRFIVGTASTFGSAGDQRGNRRR